MGSYCRFCGQRCFLVRIIPSGPCKGQSLALATCAAGMAHDRKVTGHTHKTAINPVTREIDEPHGPGTICPQPGCGQHHTAESAARLNTMPVAGKDSDRMPPTPNEVMAAVTAALVARLGGHVVLEESELAAARHRPVTAAQDGTSVILTVPRSAPHREHTTAGPADCTRCQMLRDNADWMTQP